jgi:hypothetical protein
MPAIYVADCAAIYLADKETPDRSRPCREERHQLGAVTEDCGHAPNSAVIQRI